MKHVLENGIAVGKAAVLLVSKLESIVGILLESQRRPGESGL